VAVLSESVQLLAGDEARVHAQFGVMQTPKPALRPLTRMAAASGESEPARVA
jgi:hypothetical protein